MGISFGELSIGVVCMIFISWRLLMNGIVFILLCFGSWVLRRVSCLFWMSVLCGFLSRVLWLENLWCR